VIYLIDTVMVASIAFVIYLLLTWHHPVAAPELREDGRPLTDTEKRAYAAICQTFDYESARDPHQDRRRR